MFTHHLRHSEHPGLPVVMSMIAAAATVLVLLAAAPAGAAAPGDHLWTLITPDTAWDDDELRECGLAPDGSVYVVGIRGLSATRRALFVAKYRDDGSLAWQRSYAGPRGSKFGAGGTNLTVDRKGNVIAGGYTSRRGHGQDFVVVKYSPNGVRRWRTVYDTPFHSGDVLVDLDTDASGNVYAAGFAVVGGSSASDSYLLVKLRAASGAPLWRYRWLYRGIKHPTNRVQGLDVTARGVAFLTGYSFYSDPATTRAIDRAAATIKVSPRGKKLWVRRTTSRDGMAQANDVVAASDGGCYACGGLGDPYDTMLVKFSSSGDARVHIVGSTASGVGNALVLDPSGNVDVCGAADSGAGYAGTVTEFTPEGVVAWSGTFGAYGRLDAVALDPAGNVFATGTARGAATDEDLIAAKFGAAGGLVWGDLWSAPSGQYDEGVGVCASATAVFVSGWTMAPSSQSSGVLIKYQP